MHDIIVIGSGTAGMTAALYALRAGRTVLLLEGNGIGGQIASSPKVENFPSIKEISGSEFSDNLFSQVMDLGVEFGFENALEVIDKGETKLVKTDEGEHECLAVISRPALSTVPFRSSAPRRWSAAASHTVRSATEPSSETRTLP